MATEYETFVRDAGAVLSGREVVLALRELTPGRKKYRGVNVRGVVSQPPRPGEPLLWLRSVVGVRSDTKPVQPAHRRRAAGYVRCTPLQRPVRGNEEGGVLVR